MFWNNFRGVKRAAISLLIFSALSGCGSTIRGVGKDVSRVGRGIKTIFISDEASAPRKASGSQEKPSFRDFFKVDK